MSALKNYFRTAHLVEKQLNKAWDVVLDAVFKHSEKKSQHIESIHTFTIFYSRLEALLTKFRKISTLLYTRYRYILTECQTKSDNVFTSKNRNVFGPESDVKCSPEKMLSNDTKIVFKAQFNPKLL